jgi:hypothetical protein
MPSLRSCLASHGLQEAQIWIGEINLKMFDAMMFKRTIGINCNVKVNIIDTLNDGLILSIDEDSVDDKTLSFITDFVNQKRLNLLLENERYFISKQALIPADPYQ